MKSLKERLKSQHYTKKEINGITFTIKKMDYLEFQRLAGKVKSGNADFEIELILSCIKDVTGLKVRDIAENQAEFTETELNEVLEFDLEYVQIYLGKNQEVLVQLYESIAKDFVEFTEISLKKKNS